MNDPYDEENVLSEYITTNFSQFMTEFESKAYRLSMQRVKAEGGSAAQKQLPKWIADAGPAVEAASNVGYWAVKKQITKRILREIDAGQIKINCCPACSRIARTPLARQCLWCGHDWHDRS